MALPEVHDAERRIAPTPDAAPPLRLQRREGARAVAARADAGAAQAAALTRAAALLAAGLTAAAAWALWTQPAAAQGRAAAVAVAEVDVRPLADTSPILGRFVAVRESAVAARAAGVVKEVAVEVGDSVVEGAILARLDPELSRIALDAADAALSRAEAGVATEEAALRLAEQSLERAEGLRGSTAFSRGTVEDLAERRAEAASRLQRALADVASARAERARAEYDMTHSEVRAPFSAVIVNREASLGQYIGVGDTVATLMDLSSLEIEADAPAFAAAALTPGQIIEAEMRDDGPEPIRLQTMVRAVIPREAVTTRTRAVRFSLDLASAPAALLAPGAAVTVRLPVGEPRDVVTAPKDALVQAPSGWIVFVAADDAAQPRPVRIGASAGDRVEIVTGLAPGDLVVIRGNERLRPGQPIQFTPPEGSGSEPAATTGEDASGEQGEAPAAAGETPNQADAAQTEATQG